jgi:hypothetical protein
MAFTGLLAGCANVHERPFAVGTAGLDSGEVLRVERANLAGRGATVEAARREPGVEREDAHASDEQQAEPRPMPSEPA